MTRKVSRSVAQIHLGIRESVSTPCQGEPYDFWFNFSTSLNWVIWIPRETGDMPRIMLR